MAAVKSKLCVACWKKITCRTCGCQYRRRVTSTKIGKGATQTEADEQATQAAVKYLRRRNDIWPCPHCGNQQPEMVGSLRLTWHVLILLASFAWIGPLALEYNGLVTRGVAVLLLLVLAAILVAIHVWAITRYPNNYAAVNRMRASHHVRQLLIWIDRGPDRPESEWQPPESIQPGHLFWQILVAFGLSLMLLGTCDALRWVQGWPTNPGWRPEVVGPGDDAWVFLPTTIQSLKGHWTGQTDALMETTDAPGVFIPIAASTRVDHWGNMIEVKQGETNATRHLWIRIHMPEDPKLSGKRVRIHMAMNVAYPVMDWNQREFRVRQDAVQHQEELEVAPSGAGTKFWLAWYTGALLPFLVLLALQLYCVGCAYNLRKHGGSAEVVPCDQPNLEDEVEDSTPAASAKEKDTSIREEHYRRPKDDVD